MSSNHVVPELCVLIRLARTNTALVGTVATKTILVQSNVPAVLSERASLRHGDMLPSYQKRPIWLLPVEFLALAQAVSRHLLPDTTGMRHDSHDALSPD
jgi:hypothetical protein